MNTASASSCPQCGQKIEEDGARCHACGAVISAADGFAGGAVPPSQPAFETRLAALRAAAPGAGRPPMWRRACAAVEAAGETAVAIALRPESSYRAFRFDGTLTSPVLYTLLLGAPSLLLGALGAALVSGDVARLSGARALALVLLVPPAYAFLRAHVIHLVLVFRGAASRPFTATFRVSAYANASVAPLLVLPYAGEILFLAAGAAVEAIGLHVCHRMALSSAALVEVVPSLLLVIGLAAAFVTGLLWWSQTRG